MSWLHQICSYLAIAIGTIHAFFTINLYQVLDFESLWFLSGRFWLITVGLINAVMGSKKDWMRRDLALWFITNALTAVFVVLAVHN